jgi:FAD/FMN-containing dehydrogenase
MMVAELAFPFVTFDRSIENLKARVRGAVIVAGDTEYDSARGVWHGSFDRRPTVIVRCADEYDVIAAVHFAREHELTIAVRSGGHSFAGHGTVDGGLVIDLSAMNGIKIDPERRIARVQPGVTWGEYAEAAQAHGLATSSGEVRTVGVGGLTLGGGIGWMVRKQGLTIDNLLSVELVTGDGRRVRASKQENPDLFWALRGGGGNFGVATAFEFRLHPVGTVLGGAVAYPARDAERIMRAAIDYAAAAPDELTVMVNLMSAPPAPFIPADWHGELVVVIGVCYVGDLAEGERVVAPLRTLGTPVADIIAPMPYPAIYAPTEEATVQGLEHELRSLFLNTASDDVIKTIVDYARRKPSPLSPVQFRVLGGAMARVPAEETAFAHRDKPFMLLIANTWMDPADSERQRAWVQEFYAAMRPYADGVYSNFLADEGEARVREAYTASTLKRLAAIKRQYDPHNNFQVNQNIKPR